MSPTSLALFNFHTKGLKYQRKRAIFLTVSWKKNNTTLFLRDPLTLMTSFHCEHLDFSPEKVISKSAPSSQDSQALKLCHFSHKRHQAPFRWGPNKAGSGLPMIMASRLDSSFNPLPPQPTQAIHHGVGVASNNKARRWKSEDPKSWWDKWYQMWLQVIIYSRMCHFPCLTSFWKNLCSLTTQIHLRPQNTFNTFTRQIFSSSNFQHPLAVSPHLFSRAAPCSSSSCKSFCYHQRDPPKQSCLLNNPHQSFATGGHHTDLRNIHEVARFVRFSMCFPSGLGILRSIPNLGCHRCLEWQCACHLLLNLWSSVKAHESWDLK